MDNLDFKLKKLECENHLSELNVQTYISSVIFGLVSILLLTVIIKAELIHIFNFEMVASLGMMLNTLFYMVTIQKIRREQLEFQEYLKTLNEIENGDSNDR